LSVFFYLLFTSNTGVKCVGSFVVVCIYISYVHDNFIDA